MTTNPWILETLDLTKQNLVDCDDGSPLFSEGSRRILLKGSARNTAQRCCQDAMLLFAGIITSDLTKIVVFNKSSGKYEKIPYRDCLPELPPIQKVSGGTTFAMTQNKFQLDDLRTSRNDQSIQQVTSRIDIAAADLLYNVHDISMGLFNTPEYKCAVQENRVRTIGGPECDCNRNQVCINSSTPCPCTATQQTSSGCGCT